MPFLGDLTFRAITLQAPAGSHVRGLLLGLGPSPLEIVVAESRAAIPATELRAAWRRRHGGRAAPVILVAIRDELVDLCGPTGDEPPIYSGLELSQAERVCREALALPDRHAALRWLRVALPALESRLPGIRNEGLLALHELESVRRLQQHGWAAANGRAQPLLPLTGDALLRGLGFSPDPIDQVAILLRTGANGRKSAVAVLLWPDEAAESAGLRFNGLSPISWAMDVADRENIPYVVLLQGRTLRLYPVKIGIGVGRRGRGETYVEVHTDLLRASDAAFLWMLFSADALSEGGTLQTMLAESQRFAGELAERLRERIYDLVIPRLAEGIALARRLTKPTAADLADTYGMAMTALFRLLFIAYAEDKDLLPYKHNDAYRNRSLKRKATELLELRTRAIPTGQPPTYAAGAAIWEEVTGLFHAVDGGNSTWGVPAYDGGLFTRDAALNRHGALLEEVALPDSIFGPALADLLLIETADGWGPVDFRSLNVGEFGTIYQGLLENELAVAETDLAVDSEGYYRPAKRGDPVKVKHQSIYLHNRSGQRKSTGTYYTKDFAVSHLLDRALEPALEDHGKRLDLLDETAAAEGFFDFRIADLSMGSGHFLVAAIDRIERTLTRYLARRPLPGVRTELARLRASALDALGSLAEQVAIEDGQLLRRQIARRCIYGVDLNRIAVDLARLSLWVHTFVPGLPLSLLDRNLVVGNSLVGIGQVDEFAEIVADETEDQPLFQVDARTLVGDALAPLQRLARLADATIAEVHAARDAWREAEALVAPARALFDIATAARMREEVLGLELADWSQMRTKLVGSKQHQAAKATLAALEVFHFPVAFPEVFLRARGGFDVIVGNPPWEEATLEKHAFWARHFPGLRSKSQRERETEIPRLEKSRRDLTAIYERELAEADLVRLALVTGPYPGMGTGDPDLYKGFSWRFWNLVSSQGGWIGVVLPRSAFNAKGSTLFRQTAFAGTEKLEATMLLNRGGWVFDDAEHRYTIGLVTMKRGNPVGPNVVLRGPFATRERLRTGMAKPSADFTGGEVASWTDSASLPLLPSEESLDVFVQLRRAPRLDLKQDGVWRARPHTELHATNDKELMDLKSVECPKGFWPIFKGESFDIWSPDTGKYYGWGDPKVICPALQTSRLRSAKLERSAFYEFPKELLRRAETLPCHRPRIVFRDITRATDSRTMRVALAPPNVFLTNKAVYLLWPRGDERDEAYLLGILSSLPLDWYARRFIETGLNLFLFNPMPIPRPAGDNVLRLRTIALAARLAAVDKRYAKWAEMVGVECGPLADDVKQDHIHELDAVSAHLYDLSEPQLRHVFETFHEGWDYEERMRATVRHYQAWARRR